MELLSLSVVRALLEVFSLSLGLVFHTPSLPVPESSLLGPFAGLESVTPLQLPCLAFLWSVYL